MPHAAADLTIELWKKQATIFGDSDDEEIPDGEQLVV